MIRYAIDSTCSWIFASTTTVDCATSVTAKRKTPLSSVVVLSSRRVMSPEISSTRPAATATPSSSRIPVSILFSPAPSLNEVKLRIRLDQSLLVIRRQTCHRRSGFELGAPSHTCLRRVFPRHHQRHLVNGLVLTDQEICEMILLHNFRRPFVQLGGDRVRELIRPIVDCRSFRAANSCRPTFEKWVVTPGGVDVVFRILGIGSEVHGYMRNWKAVSSQSLHTAIFVSRDDFGPKELKPT